MDNETIEPKATEVGLFWSTTNGVVSRLIRRVLGCEWSHVGLVMLFDGTEVYYEALAGRGIVGPRLVSALEAWSYKPGHKLDVRWAWWLSPQQAELIHQRALALQAAAGYGTFQLIAHWWFERVRKRWGGRMRNTPGKVTCSEFVSRAMYPDVKLFDDHRDHHDAVTPASSRVAFFQIESSMKPLKTSNTPPPEGSCQASPALHATSPKAAEYLTMHGAN